MGWQDELPVKCFAGCLPSVCCVGRSSHWATLIILFHSQIHCFEYLLNSPMKQGRVNAVNMCVYIYICLVLKAQMKDCERREVDRL